MKPGAIRSLRRRNDWTQAELAERLGTDAVTVSRWERGVSSPRPSARARMRRLAAPLPRDVSFLVSVVGDEATERLLQRAALLERRPAKHRFVTDPTRRLREIDRARREQLALKAAARLAR